MVKSKKILSLFLAVIMTVLMLLPATAMAAEGNNDGLPEEVSISTVFNTPVEVTSVSEADSAYYISAGVTANYTEDSLSAQDITAYEAGSDMILYTGPDFAAPAAGPINLAVGPNITYVKVVSPEPEITAYYTLTIYRMGGSDVTGVKVSHLGDFVTNGGTQSFSAVVEGENNPGQDVSWSIVGEVVTGTAISVDGLLTVAADETADTLTVMATSAADSGKYGTAAVAVINAEAVVTGVKVSPSSASVTKGKTCSFSAVVEGEDNPGQDVVWSITGEAAAGTFISTVGLLTVAADETADTLTVVATSLEDSNKSGTATVTLVAPLDNGVYSVPLNFYSGMYAIDSKKLLTNGTPATQFDKRALVRAVDGGYEVTLQYNSHSIYDFIQIVDPEKLNDVKAILNNPSSGYGTFNDFPAGNFNWPAGLGEPRTIDPAETSFVSPDFNKYYLKDVEITQADADIDTGYITFRVPNLTDEVLIKSYSRAVSVSNNSQSIRLIGLIMHFDPSLALRLPDSLTLEKGSHTLGYAWTNQAKNSLATAAQVGRMDVTGTVTTIGILQDAVAVTVGDSGRLTATFTLKPDDPVVSVERVVSRDMDLNAGAAKVKLYWVDAHGNTATYEPLDISNGSFTLTYEDMAFGIPLRIKTASTGSQYYFGSLRLDPVQVTEGVKSDNGVRLAYRSSAMSENSIFAAPSYMDYGSSRKAYLSQDRFDSYTAYGAVIKGVPHYLFYSVSLTYENEPVTPQEPVTLSFPIPAGWDPDRVTLYYFGNLNTNNPSYSVDSQNRTVSITTKNAKEINSDYLLLERGQPDDLSKVASEDGLYRTKVFIKNANKDDVSMSSFTVVGNNGYIEVKNGQKTLYYEAQPTSVGGIPGWMRRAFYYDGSEMKGEANYLSYHAKDDGSLMLNDNSDYYMIYPKKVAVPLLGTVSGGYYKIGFNIPVMDGLGGNDSSDGYHVTADALLMFQGVERIGGTNPLAAYDRTIIRAQLDKAGMLPEDARNALAADVSRAQAVYVNSGATSEEIKAAADALAEAIKAVEGLETPDISSIYNGQNNSYTVTITSRDSGTVKYRLSGSESGAGAWLNYTAPFVVDSTDNSINQGILYVSAYAASPDGTKDSGITTLRLDFRQGGGPGTIRDGEYTIPVNLWHSVNNEPSMGNNALAHTAALVVKDGQGTLHLTFSPLEFMNMKGYLSQLDLLDNVVLNENNYPVAYDLIPAAVLTTYDVVDDFNRPGGSDPNCAGKPYPHEITVPVTLNQEYTWAHVYVPIMGSMGFGDQVARIKLDWSGLASAGQPDPDTAPVKEIGDNNGDGIIDLTENDLSDIPDLNKNMSLRAGAVTLNIPARYVDQMFSGNSGAALQFKVNESPEGTKNAIIGLVGDGDRLTGTLDINLSLGGQNISSLGGRVRITISLTAAQTEVLRNAGSRKLCYYDPATGRLTDMNAVFDLTGKTVTFYTDHLSTYVVVASESAGPGGPGGPGGLPGNSHGLKNGTYSIRVHALQEYSSDRSMADQFFIEPAELAVSGETIGVTAIMYGTKSSAELPTGIRMSYITSLQYKNASGNWVDAVGSRNNSADTITARMTVSGLDDIYMRVMVPDYMGNDYKVFRLVFDRGSIKEGGVDFGSGIVPPLETGVYTIKASADSGGSISPSGDVEVKKDGDQTFTITADKEHAIKDVLVDGKSVGAVNTYSFTKVNEDHSISATFNKTAVAAAPAPVFKDTANHWAKNAIGFVVEKGIFSGTSATTFSPDAPMTRGMFVTVLGHIHGVDVSKYKTVSFTDVNASQYYAPYVAWAAKNGIVSGVGNNKFAPDNTVTREQAATMLAKYRAFAGIDNKASIQEKEGLADGLYTVEATALKENSDELSMSDQFLTEKAKLTVAGGKLKLSMTWHGTGYITMDMIKELKYQQPDGSFVEINRTVSADKMSMELSLNIADINKATVIQVYVPAGMGESRPKFRLVLDPDTLTKAAAAFADDAKISPWAKDNVHSMQLAGLFNGDDNGNFNPQNPITRAEAASVFAKSLGFEN